MAPNSSPNSSFEPNSSLRQCGYNNNNSSSSSHHANNNGTVTMMMSQQQNNMMAIPAKPGARTGQTDQRGNGSVR